MFGKETNEKKTGQLMPQVPRNSDISIVIDFKTSLLELRIIIPEIIVCHGISFFIFIHPHFYS